MKGFAIFAMFSISYVLLVLLFHGIVGAELNSEEEAAVGENQGEPPLKFPHLRQGQQEGGNPLRKNGSANPLVDVFQIEDPQTKGILDAVYGTYNGEDQCMRKSACIAGNYMKELPGRDLMFILMGGYIPPEYSLFYDIFRNSALYGQNCNVYVCMANNQGQAPVTPTGSVNSQHP